MRAGFFLIAVVILSGCVLNKSNLNADMAKENEAVIAKLESYILDNPGDYNRIATFNEAILNAYKTTISDTSSAAYKIGFVYKIIPKGAVNPFSEVDIACMVQKKYSKRRGAALCNKFFKNIEEEFKR